MNKLVVLTGLDGSGTSSVAEMLHQLDTGSSILYGLNDPYMGCREKIDLATRIESSSAHYFFYLSANIHASSLIRKALESGNVYCVRYLIDTVISHRVAGLNADLVYKTDLYEILEPNLTVFLSVEESVRQARLEKRGKGYLDVLLDNDTFRRRFLREFAVLSGCFKTIDVSEKSVFQIAEEVRRLMESL